MLWPEIKPELTVLTISLDIKVAYIAANLSLATRPVYFLDHFSTVPPGKEYNGCEKMVLLFSEVTWLWILVTFASTFVLKFTSP